MPRSRVMWQAARVRARAARQADFGGALFSLAPAAMARKQKTTVAQPTARTFSIPNKLHRQAHNVRIKSALASTKRKERFERKKVEDRDPTLKAERLATNIPATLERKRVWDERVPGAEAKRQKLAAVEQEEKEKKEEGSGAGGDEDDEELAKALQAHEAMQTVAAEAEETNSLFPTLAIPPTTSPRVLITTNRNCHVHAPAEELTALFPNSTYVPRGAKLSVREIASFAAKPSTVDPTTKRVREPFSHLVIVNEDRKLLNALTVVVLPEGPTFHFSLSNYTTAKAISGHGNPTSHTPELILNNFLTPLGRTTASLFQGMFPRVPEFQGRQAVTLHNQRDYIFFRRHRYVFRDKKEREKDVGYGLDGPDGKPGGAEIKELDVKVGLQELGPRFTLKLRKVERGIQEGVVWEWKGGMEKDRKKFQL